MFRENENESFFELSAKSVFNCPNYIYSLAQDLNCPNVSTTPIMGGDKSNLLVLSSWKVNIAENPIAVMGLYICSGTVTLW